MRSRFGRPLKPLRQPGVWFLLWCMAVVAVVGISLLPMVDQSHARISDKLQHFIAYFVLAAAAVQLFASWPALIGAGLALVLLGVGVEYAQGALTVTRTADRMDAVANAFGVAAGLATRLTPLRNLLLSLEARWLPRPPG